MCGALIFEHKLLTEFSCFVEKAYTLFAKLYLSSKKSFRNVSHIDLGSTEHTNFLKY